MSASYYSPYVPIMETKKQNMYILDLTKNEKGWGNYPFNKRMSNREFMDRVRSYHGAVNIEKLYGSYLMDVVDKLLPKRTQIAKVYIEDAVKEIDLIIVDDYSNEIIVELFGSIDKFPTPTIHYSDYQILLEYQKIL